MKKKKTTSKPKEVLVNFVLDETGSMQCCKEATIKGFNEYIGNLKRDKKVQYRFSLTKFNSEKVEVVCKKEPLKKVKELTPETYQPDKMTPLYDAIGKTINELKGEKGKVLMIIMTDGAENASKEYNRQKIFDLIKEKEKDGWTFVFLGANQDSWETGQSIGLQKGNVANYNQANARKALHRVSSCTSHYAHSRSLQSSNFYGGRTDVGGNT